MPLPFLSLLQLNVSLTLMENRIMSDIHEIPSRLIRLIDHIRKIQHIRTPIIDIY